MNSCSRKHYAWAPIFALALVVGLSGPLNAQTFKPIDPLFFTKPFGGADPLPQILSVSSTGTAFRINAAATTSTGGSWLSVSPVGTNCCGTPQVFQVIVNAAVALAAGSYTGQVVFSSGANSLTVPVTLVVAAPGATFFDNMPGGLSFTAKTGATSFTSQQLQVRNGVTGPLNWSVTATTFDSANWLTVSNASGTAPSFVTVGINAANLPNGGLVAGVFDGMLKFQGAGSTITVPISVTIGDSIFEQMNGLSFTKPFAGQDPLPQILQTASTGAAFRFGASAVSATGGDWITVSPAGGNCCGTPSTLSVSVNPAITLAAGTYTAQVFLSSNGGDIAIVIPVSLTIAPAGSTFLDNMPGQLSFTLTTGGGDPPAQLVQVRNGGSGSLNWTLIASTFNNAPWLNVTPIAGTAPSFVSVSISVANLPDGGLTAGTFSGQLLFQDATSSVTVPISVVVSAGAAFEQINGLSFTKPFGGANPLPQIITPASIGSAFRFSAFAFTATGGDWLSISPAGGNCCGTPAPLTVSVNPVVTLAPGTYTGEVYLTNGSNAIIVPVTLIIGDPATAFFDNMAGQLSFSLATGGSNPPAQQIQVRNGGTGTLNWTASTSTSDGGNWLTISPPSGTAPSTVTIGIVAPNLPNAALVAGVFTGEVLFESGGNTATVPISVVVGGNTFAQVNPISFTKTFGGANPLPQTLTLTSIGAAFRFSATAAAATGGNWLTVSPAGGNCCGTPSVVTVTVNPSVSLAAGTYTGEVVFNSGIQAITVPVTLTVAPVGGTVFDNVQGQISFSSLVGGASLTSQPITIRNAGSGTLNWDLVASTFDNGNWLTVSSTSGTAPATITVGIVPGNLPNLGLVADHFTGQLLFRSTSGNVTVPLSVELGPDVFVQRNGLTFTKAFGSPSPLSQTVTVSSTGVNFRYAASADSGNGGSWLTVTPSGGNCCGTPEVNTASVTAAAAFPGGTFTGQLVFNQGTRAMTVPVTLNVSGGATLVSVTPNTGQQGQTLASVAIVGQNTNFVQGATVANFGAGITVNSLTVNSATSATANITVQSGATPGAGTVTMTTGTVVAWLTNGFTVIAPNPALSIAKTHTTNFTQGQNGAMYSVTVSNAIVAVPTSGTVTVTETVPVGMTLVSMAGTNWACPGGGPTCTRSDVLAAGASYQPITVTVNVGSAAPPQLTNQVSVSGGGSASASATDPTTIASQLRFVPVTPCRIADTRNAAGPFGGPAIAANTSRDFEIPAGSCGIPSSALAYSFNVTVLPSGSLLYLSMWPTGLPLPVVSTLNALDGRWTANAAIVPAGTSGSVSVFVSDTTHVVLDINGYFVPAATSGALAFYPLTPCRVMDTRSGASIGAGGTLTVPVRSSACSVPSGAVAYSLNFTALPHGPLGWITTWPTGQAMPTASTLNAPTGTITANAAILPAGASGSVDVYASDATDLLVDINGYFAPPGTGGLSFYTLTPCRVADTRYPAGPFGGPTLVGTRDFAVPASACRVPSGAQAYSLNATVWPATGFLNWLTLWPEGGAMPVVSTLNSWDGRLVANAAIVPTTNGSISAYASDLTTFFFDINGYFAP